jgi:hypothetical protein
MPISYLDSSDPPDTEITNWLSWTDEDFKKIVDGETFVADLMGIARSGDVQIIYKPILIKNKQNEPLAFAGNASQYQSEPSFIFLDIDSVSNFYLIEKPFSIPTKLRPTSAIPAKMVKDTTWETLEQVAICSPPILAPIFFGQKPVKASIYDHNFVNCMASISQTHEVWAELMLEIFNQQENDNGDIDKIIDSPIKKL